ncbi:MAG: holo-ACP synthase [Candidatus Riflebacteria bacterium]|nr:holo-ACP synthase [Candidatus Riflebacteria bacterium]
MDTIVGTGVDVVEIRRMARSIERSREAFDSRCFTPAERLRADAARDAVVHRAALFAAKEALFKAIGLTYDGGFDWLDLNVDPVRRGSPGVACTGAVARALGSDRLLLSLAFGSKHVVALALRVRPRNSGATTDHGETGIRSC